MVIVGGEKRCISAWLAVFALCFRNGAEASASVLGSDRLVTAGLELERALGAGGTVDGAEGVALVAVATSCHFLRWELGSKSSGSIRMLYEKYDDSYYRQQWYMAHETFSTARILQLLPFLLEVLASNDVVTASGVLGMGAFNYQIYSLANIDADFEKLLSPELLTAILALRSRIAGPPGQTTAEWWNARAETPSLETTCLSCVWLAVLYQAIIFSGHVLAVPAALIAGWREVVDDAVHIAVMTKAVDLTQGVRSVCVHCMLVFSLRTLANVSSIPSQQEALISSEGFVKALLYIAQHDNTYSLMSTTSFASITAVNLIGRNEGGLTLTRPAVDAVLNLFKSHFDPSSRRSKYPVKRMIGEGRALVHLIVPDANKAFAVQHAGQSTA
jgi:hypothetical protein